MLSEAILSSLVLVGLSYLILPWVPPENSVARRVFVGVLTLLRLMYFSWRIGYTLPDWDASPEAWFAYAFLALELVVAFASHRFLSSLLGNLDRRSEADRHERWYEREGYPPLVDVLIATYNESERIVEKTIIGARLQDYPNFRVWVLDDGRRESMRALAKELNVGYLTRADNAHAKAGNLNSAWQQLQRLPQRPEYLAVLDADFIPRPGFLRRSLSLMHAPEVAVVQTPQYHLNDDLFQSRFRARRGWPDTQRFVFEVILPARDAAGGAFCCGTSFVMRAAALADIGGFPTEAVTEDMLMTVKLGGRGWRTVYLKELLSAGYAPEGLHEYLTQRARWAMGNAQIARLLWASSRSQPLLGRLLTLENLLRWSYTSLARLLFLLVPIVFWTTKIVPYNATFAEMVLYSVPFMCGLRLLMSWMSRGTQLPIVYDAGVLLAAMTVVRGTIVGLFSRKAQRFVVTDKGANSEHTVWHWRTLRWFAGYTLLLVFLLLMRWESGELLELTEGYGLVITFWTVLNLVTIAIAAIPCIEPPRRRAEERYPTTEALRLRVDGRWYPASGCDISVDGLRLSTPAALHVGSTVTVELSRVGAVAARVVRAAQDGSFGLSLQTEPAERRACIAKIFCSDDYVQPVCTGSVWETAKAALGLLAR